MVVICDSSPLVALALIDKLDLLDKLFAEVLVPKHVFAEINIPGKVEAERINQWAKNKVVEAKDKYLVQAFSMILDKGESEALSLYCEKKADFLLIDEKKGRKIAMYNGMKVIGTLGVLILSKQKGFLSELRPLLNVLQGSSIRISAELYNKALEMVNE